MLYATVRNRKIHVKKPDTVIQNGVNVDWLKLEMDDEWAEMESIVCVFVNRYTEEVDGKLTEKEITKEMLHTFGEKVLVPWECLEKTGMMSVSCTGYVGGEKVMTTMYPDSFWDVVQNGPVSGDETIEPTPSLYNQILAAAGEATAAAIAANQAKDQLLQDKANGVFDGADGKNAKVSVGSTKTGSEGSEAEVYATGTEQDLKLNFVIPRGAPGRDGTPGRDGSPGRDGIDGKDGEPGQPGRDGVDGRDGKDGSPGRDGRDGVDGENGRGIAEIVDNGNGTWTIRFTDGTTQTVKPPAPIEGGEGVPGEDGGYYIPKVENGVLSWIPSKADMPEVESEDIKGEPGKDGTSVTVSSVSESAEDGGTNVVTFSDGKKLNVRNGSKGGDGKTPVKGTDYFTEADKQEIAQQAAALVEVPEGFSGSWNDLKDKPSSFTPASHNQAASTITAGTFAGQVAANASGQTPGISLLRNTLLVSADTAPTVNGEICWKYE